MSEYLIFNIIVFAGPFFFGLTRRHYFADKWGYSLFSIIIVGIPFIIWDSLVTNSHWMFNKNFVMGIYFANLPIEEWLFFITVPFACLYTWEMIQKQMKLKTYSLSSRVFYVIPLLIIAGVILFVNGLEYTGLVFLFFSAALICDLWLDTRLLLQNRFYLLMFFVVLFTLIFNSYLTWRPVVLYGESYQIGFRIFTIPIEDFLYGISLIYLNTIFYEKIKQVGFSRLAIRFGLSNLNEVRIDGEHRNS